MKRKKKIKKIKKVIENCNSWIEHFSQKKQKATKVKKIIKFNDKIGLFQEHLNEKLEELKALNSKTEP